MWQFSLSKIHFSKIHLKFTAYEIYGWHGHVPVPGLCFCPRSDSVFLVIVYYIFFPVWAIPVSMFNEWRRRRWKIELTQTKLWIIRMLQNQNSWLPELMFLYWNKLSIKSLKEFQNKKNTSFTISNKRLYNI